MTENGWKTYLSKEGEEVATGNRGSSRFNIRANTDVTGAHSDRDWVALNTAIAVTVPPEIGWKQVHPQSAVVYMPNIFHSRTEQYASVVESIREIEQIHTAANFLLR